MNRREFLEICGALGASLPFFSLVGCSDDDGLYWDFDVRFDGKVVVVGAGAAGLAAGYLLDRYGIDFEILEAADVIGGRVRQAEDFTDFPIDLGAEWIHEDPSVLTALIDDPTVEGTVDLVPYSPETVANAQDGRIVTLNLGSNYYSDYKFKRSTWFGFLEQYIARDILDRITTSRPVVQIDSTGDRIELTDAAGGIVEADRVLITVPLKVLQTGGITFLPTLPRTKAKAVDSISMPPGLKVFLEFSERFYPDITLVGPLTAQDKIYYDAAFRKDSDRHVLALFHVAEQASALTDLDSDQAIVDAVLEELDEIFDGQATPAFLRAVVQNWSAEPFVLGSYSYDWPSDWRDTIARLNEPIEDRIWFAGEALSEDNSATVPGAMQSAYASVRALLER